MRFAYRSALIVILWAAPLMGQRARLDIDVTAVTVVEDGAGAAGPAITTANLLADPRTQDPLVHGAFPTGIHFRLELWRKGLVNDLDGRTEWDVLVSYDPTKKTFSVVRQQAKRSFEDFGSFATLAAAEAEIGRPFRVSLRPRGSGRYYYNLIVEVRTLTETDLDALQQWLRGPKAQGSRNPLTFIGTGFKKLLSRVLGGDKQHYERQSGVFTVP